MGVEHFKRLARELAERDRELADQLGTARASAEYHRALAAKCIERFCSEARAEGADHLANLLLEPVGWDEKHVDCFQFCAARGRWEAVFVFKASGSATLVGPYKRGAPEKPCATYDLDDPEVEAGVEALLLTLIRKASER